MNNKRVNNGLTISLYEDNAYVAECRARVLECRECVYSNKEHEEPTYGIVLDRTVFFPEGGGQPADEGWLRVLQNGYTDEEVSEKEESLQIIDVQKKEGVILHYVKKPLTVGCEVKAILDWDLRYQRMQNHSGEHLFCGLIHKLYGYENVGFHMSKDCVTVDVNGVLTAEDFMRLEKLANEGVDANVKIETVYPDSPDEMDYRSKLELTEDIRVVLIEGYDACACCAPHVKSTAEIGLIKVMDFMSHRGGTRFVLKSGQWARTDYGMLHEEISRIMRLFSAKREECHLASERISDQLRTQQETINALKKQITDLHRNRVREMIQKNPKASVIPIFAEALDDVQMRTLVNESVAVVTGPVAGFIGTDEGGYRYIIGKNEAVEKPDLREFAKVLNARLNGRGGGSAKMIQGSVMANRKEIESFLNEIM